MSIRKKDCSVITLLFFRKAGSIRMENLSENVDVKIGPLEDGAMLTWPVLTKLGLL